MKFNEVEDVRLFERNDQHKTKGSKQTNDRSQKCIDLFGKYLLTKSENHNVGKTNKEESDVIKKKSPPPPRPLIPLTMPSSTFDCYFSRPPSLLERRLLPGIIPALSSDEKRTSSSTGNNDKSSKAQLTIFYAGAVNVYDNVPTDTAQAILLLAGESSLSKPIANEKPKTEAKTPLHHRPNMTETSCKLQAAGLPIARKISLHHFLEKRRRRIVSNSPYAAAPAPAPVNCSNNRDEEKENALINLEHYISMENNRSISLSPFPSRLGYCLPAPPN